MGASETFVDSASWVEEIGEVLLGAEDGGEEAGRLEAADFLRRHCRAALALAAHQRPIRNAWTVRAVCGGKRVEPLTATAIRKL